MDLNKEKVYQFTIFIFLLFIVGGVAWHFSQFFDYKPYEMNLDNWEKTSSYFSNIFTPIFTLVTVLLLTLNLKAMNKTNRLSINQLELSIFQKNTRDASFNLISNCQLEYKQKALSELMKTLGNNPILKNKLAAMLGVCDCKDTSQLRDELFRFALKFECDLKMSLSYYRHFSFDEGILKEKELMARGTLPEILTTLVGKVFVNKLKTRHNPDSGDTPLKPSDIDKSLTALELLMKDLLKQKREERDIYPLYIKSFIMNFDMELIMLMVEYDNWLFEKDLKEELKNYK